MDINCVPLRSLQTMLKTCKIQYWLLVGVLLVNGQALAQSGGMSSAEVTTFKNQVAKQASGLQTLEADFVQLKHLDFIDQAIKSVGKLSFKSPQHIRWEYTSPFRYYVIFDDKRMFINDDGNTKDVSLASNTLLRDINNMLAGTVQGDAIFDEERFDIAYHRVGREYQTTFFPKEKSLAKYIKQIEMTFDPNSYLVTRIRIIEPSMDHTEITFANQKRNITIPDEIFSHR